MGEAITTKIDTTIYIYIILLTDCSGPCANVQAMKLLHDLTVSLQNLWRSLSLWRSLLKICLGSVSFNFSPSSFNWALIQCPSGASWNYWLARRAVPTGDHGPLMLKQPSDVEGSCLLWWSVNFDAFWNLLDIHQALSFDPHLFQCKVWQEKQLLAWCCFSHCSALPQGPADHSPCFTKFFLFSSNDVITEDTTEEIFESLRHLTDPEHPNLSLEQLKSPSQLLTFPLGFSLGQTGQTHWTWNFIKLFTAVCMLRVVESGNVWVNESTSTVFVAWPKRKVFRNLREETGRCWRCCRVLLPRCASHPLCPRAALPHWLASQSRLFGCCL